MSWSELFVPTTPVIEVLVRGTITYLFLFLALRFFLKRNAGELGVADLLVIVLISEAAQNAMGSEDKSITEAAILVATILFWAWFLNWLSFRYAWARTLTGADPLPLVVDGRLQGRNMRRELITRDELMSQLRQQGIEDLAKVKRACLEGDGSFSVIRRDGGETDAPDTGFKGG